VTPLHELIDDPWFPFEGEIVVKALQPAVVPEPPRSGVVADDCSLCTDPDAGFVWANADWRLRADRDTPCPGVVLLVPRDHYDSYADLPATLLAELGPMTARVERAVLSIGDVARVHVCRWGDGSAHFHQWFLPRPLGALQLRGSMLPMWMDLLPVLPAAEIDSALELIAAAMRAGD
jgi:diadenosine tetraphosphate (Ap4A) HIT family hydrolase